MLDIASKYFHASNFDTHYDYFVYRIDRVFPSTSWYPRILYYTDTYWSKSFDKSNIEIEIDLIVRFPFDIVSNDCSIIAMTVI